jgi:DNA repair exonuclease SbcCD nuclease subunit
MFDSDSDANALRPQLRPILSNNGFKILVIPGNHDSNSFASNTYYGDDFEVITTEPFQTKTVDDLAITALPYREEADDILIAQLKRAKKRRKKNFLLIHCTLDLGFGLNDFGEERQVKYFPISQQTVSDLKYDYVLAGHFHSNQFERTLNSGGVFLYPGSPVSLSKKERGKRCVILIDTEKDTRQFLELKSYYYDELNVNTFPGNERKVIAEIQRWVSKRSKDNCEMDVIVNGFISISEQTFNRNLRKAAIRANLVENYRSVKNILEYPLYKRFKKKLDTIDLTIDKEELEMLVLKVISKLADTRGLQI